MSVVPIHVFGAAEYYDLHILHLGPDVFQPLLGVRREGVVKYYLHDAACDVTEQHG